MMKKNLFKKNIISLLLFEIIYRCLYFLLFFPFIIKIFEYVLEKVIIVTLLTIILYLY